MPEADHSARRRAVESARAAGLQVMTVPSFDDLMSGRVTVSQIRNVELDDLLGRDPVKLDTAGLREWLGSRVVLVSGAGGSIGSELCRQIARYQPQRIVLLESSEFALYTIEQEFAQRFPDVAVSARDRRRQGCPAHRAVARGACGPRSFFMRPPTSTCR